MISRRLRHLVVTASIPLASGLAGCSSDSTDETAAGGTSAEAGSAGAAQGGAGNGQGGAGTGGTRAGSGGVAGAGAGGAGAGQGGAGNGQDGAGAGQGGAGQSQGGAGQAGQGGAGTAGTAGNGNGQGGAENGQGGAGQGGGGGDSGQAGAAGVSGAGMAGAGEAGSAGAAGMGDSGMGGAGGSSPCSPHASCLAADKKCLALVDNTGKTKFGLRMSQITFSTPSVFQSGLVASTLSGSATPDEQTCNLGGTGSFSWLLQFDKAAGTIKSGTARPVADPTQGYVFDDETIGLFHVQPVTSTGTVGAGGAFGPTEGADLVVVAWLDSNAQNSILLPLHGASVAGTLSASGSCVGAYNAAGLDPAQSCQPDNQHPAFLGAGQGAGYLSLEEADTSLITALNESLCVLLSGDATTYSQKNDKGQTVCKRDGSNAILYHGNYCLATNTAGDCQDAVAVGFEYAASGIQINE